MLAIIKRACLILALCTLPGLASAELWNSVFKFYSDLARMGNQEAMLYLSGMYLDGRGTERDPDLAREWLEKAAELGNTTASARLRQLQEQGEAEQPGATEPAVDADTRRRQRQIEAEVAAREAEREAEQERQAKERAAAERRRQIALETQREAERQRKADETRRAERERQAELARRKAEIEAERAQQAELERQRLAVQDAAERERRRLEALTIEIQREQARLEALVREQERAATRATAAPTTEAAQPAPPAPPAEPAATVAAESPAQSATADPAFRADPCKTRAARFTSTCR